MSQIKVPQRQQRAVLQKIPGWSIIYTGPDNTYTMHVHIIIYTAWLVGWLVTSLAAIDFFWGGGG